MGWYGGFRPYVSVAKRRANAAKEMAKLAKKGRVITPVKLDSKKIATTFWGKAWCENLESYSDFENRLPRGRTYVRNGSVVDLQIEAGRISAVVSGSELYEVTIKIKPLLPKIWTRLKSDCGGKIGSLVELLQGRLAQGVMELVTRKEAGLFPAPAEIDMECSCPDWAGMCKHVAAVLYGIGARLDQQPHLLFALREVDHLDLISNAAAPAIASSAATTRQTIAADDLADVFGIEIDTPTAPTPWATVMTDVSSTVSTVPARRKASAAVPGKQIRDRRKGLNAQGRTKESVSVGTHPTKQKIEAGKPRTRRKPNRARLVT